MRITNTRLAFTLAELVGVIVIMTIMLAIAMPRVAGFIQTDRLRRAAVQAATDLRIAQGEAIKAQRFVTVQYSTAESAYHTIYASDGGKVPGTSTVLLGADLYRATLASADFAGEREAVFDRFGMPLAGGSLIIGINDLRIAVTLDGATGRVTIAPIQRIGVRLPVSDGKPRSIAFPSRKFIPAG